MPYITLSVGHNCSYGVIPNGVLLSILQLQPEHTIIPLLSFMYCTKFTLYS